MHIGGSLLSRSESLASRERQTKRPNIILILVDDMGFSDIGCYGSEIATPNLDKLAAGGLRFNQFYNCARCCPSRASLLTGLYPHQIGIGHMTNFDDHNVHDTGFRGYRGFLNRDCVTIAEALKESGYHTLMAGKWHVGRRQGAWPLDRGFEEFYGVVHGPDHYFRPTSWSMLARGNRLVEPEGDKYYTTDVFTDYAVEFMDKYGRQDAPFFLYLCHNAPHWPLHAWPEDIAKYKGKYMIGWDEVRDRRLARIKEIGILDEKTGLTERHPEIPAWTDLPEQKKVEWDLRMAVYAAMIDRLDQNIGRIIDKIRELGVEENTLIMFLSDNGGCAEPYDRKPGVPPGGPESDTGLLLPWANVNNTPFKEYKHWVHEGGIGTPFIAHWPDVIKNGGAITDQIGHVIDIMATCMDVSGATYPTTYNGHAIMPLEGKSLAPIFRGEKREGHKALFWEHEGNRAVRERKWKLVSKYSDFGIHWGNEWRVFPNQWELYDMENDRAELHDLAEEHPEIVKRLSDKHDQWAERVGVVPWPEVLKKWNENKERRLREIAEGTGK